MTSLKLVSPDEASIISRFDHVIRRIVEANREIVDVFVFLPPQQAYIWGETYHELGFYTIVCPRIQNKKGEKEDTVDDTLIRFGKMAIDNMKDLSFICLGSGDKDFSPLVRQARKKGLEIIVVAASTNSLSSDLINLADKTFFLKPIQTD
ncbi:NYN domain-containing protein [Patescibacteria group bacterium]|nr:NYN domain-containing protein [Patescibacteria group bacterium]